MVHFRKIAIILFFDIAYQSNATIMINATQDNSDIQREGYHTPKETMPTSYTNDDVKSRTPKIFSIFSVVQFKNLACTSTMLLNRQTTGLLASGSTYRNGTCMTAPECSQKGGSESGTCAGGFGVCCVIMVSTCGSVISQNCSYIKNPGFPSALTDTSLCKYTIAKCDASVCDFRLDFESFDIAPPANTIETADDHACQDTFTAMVNTGSPSGTASATGTTSSFNAFPVICGNNQGQHIYLDAGTLSTDTAMITFTFDSTITHNRFWDIKVSQIPCRSKADPPDGCLQYHTGVDGRFETFNFPGTTTMQHLQNQDYRVCIRQEEGYCGIQYCACSTANSMSIHSAENAIIGSNCAADWVEIEGSSCSGTATGSGLINKYCGEFLSHTADATTGCCIVDCHGPFEVGFRTDSETADATSETVSNRGTCLEYIQLPCGAACGNP